MPFLSSFGGGSVRAFGFTSLSGNFVTVIQSFTATGDWVCPTGVTEVECLVVAGGGGGGGGGGDVVGGSGGGAGGYVYSSSTVVTAGTNYTITVGAGGAGARSRVPPSGALSGPRRSAQAGLAVSSLTAP